MDETQNTPSSPSSLSAEKPDRLARLSRDPNETRTLNEKYSAFIRSLRIALPLIALCIIAVLFSWNSFKPDKILPIIADEQNTPVIGKNELITPRFESLDDDNQPYTVTADRAVQDTKDGVLILDNPLADIALNSGNWLALMSEQAAYAQDSQRLLMKDNVRLFHDEGYTIRTEELNVDLKASSADTDLDIYGFGPAGTLDAKGMDVNSKTGILVFSGPAKLVLFDTQNKNGNGVFNP